MLSTKDVIQYLNQHGNVQAIEDMAAFFSVTPRTIRNHLRSVQDAYPACLQVGRGQVKRLKQIPEESSPSAQVPSSQQERSRYILRALLSRSEPMDLDELAASLFISEVTLQNEVKLIRHEIAEYHLSLRTKNNTLFISGSEKDKKRLMIHLIYNEAQHTLVSMETLHAIFPRYDIQKIRSDILACLNSQHFFIDEYTSGSQIILRDNLAPMVKGKHVLILAASITTGYTIQAAVEAVNYYGGIVAGLSAIFATTHECLGYPVTSIFDPTSLPDYASFDSRDCPLCKAGQHIDALVNSFGYSAL